MENKPMNILAVDDTWGIRTLLSMIIEEEGHNCFTAANGLEVLEVIRTSDIQLVFLDIKLPVMNGISVLEKLNTFDRRPYVVAITSFSEGEIIERVKNNGADRCIIKPFDIDEIREIIRRMAFGNK